MLRARAAGKTRLHRDLIRGSILRVLSFLLLLGNGEMGGPGRRSPLRARKRLSGFTFCQVPVQRDIVCFFSSLLRPGFSSFGDERAVGREWPLLPRPETPRRGTLSWARA